VLETAGPVVRSADGPEGRTFALPAAGARDQAGGYVLVIIWFGPQPGDQIVTLARSGDARTWRLGTEPILDDLGMQLVHPDAVPTSIRQLDDGTWVMFGWASHATSPDTFFSWRASAPAPEGPWALDREDLLVPGAAGSWDSNTASIGSVQPAADGWLAWYEGSPEGRSLRGDIGLATSKDGLAWAKAPVPPNPVIPHGICGTGTSVAVFQPQIELAPNGFVGVIGGYGPGRNQQDLYGLTSGDGRTWLCSGSTPVLRYEDIPGSEGIHTFGSVPLADGRVGLLIESLGDSKSDIWLATVEVAP
jgi:hypothetical protein